MLTENAFFLRLWMFWGSAGAQSASSAVHSADPWPYHICTFRKIFRCGSVLRISHSSAEYWILLSVQVSLLSATAGSGTAPRHSSPIHPEYLHRGSYGCIPLPPGTWLPSSHGTAGTETVLHIVKNMSAHSAISYIHSISHLPDHTPDPQANVTQYTFDTPCSFNSAAISSRVVPVV